MKNLVCITCGKARRRNHVGAPGYCNPCHAEYQRAYRQKNKEKIAKKDKDLDDRRRRFIQEKKSQPCTDCGTTYPHWIMDFDHLPGKTKLVEISVMVSKGCSLARIETEIAKCEVVCANCHRNRTYMRRTQKSAKLLPLPAPALLRKRGSR